MGRPRAAARGPALRSPLEHGRPAALEVPPGAPTRRQVSRLLQIAPPAPGPNQRLELDHVDSARPAASADDLQIEAAAEAARGADGHRAGVRRAGRHSELPAGERGALRALNPGSNKVSKP